MPGQCPLPAHRLVSLRHSKRSLSERSGQSATRIYRTGSINTRPKRETAPPDTAPDRRRAARPPSSRAISRPVTGPSVSPQWAWPMVSHRPGRPGARPITGRESGKHGREPSQVLSSARSPSANNRARMRHQPVELHRRRRRIAGGEFGAGGEPDALLHRRDQIAVLHIDHRPRQRRIALAPEVTVIAALDRHRQFEAERLEQIRRPGPERDHHLRRIERAFVGLHPPEAAGAMQRARVAIERDAAERGKARGIGARHRQADCSRSPPSARTPRARTPD